MVLQIECPPGFRVAALIGPKGAKIKELKSESGAKIEIDSTPPPKVVISGTDAQVEAASALVLAILHPPSARLTCDKDHARLLIGPGGSVLKRLQAESGARINVDTAADPAAITIEAASQDAVDAAAALVHAITEPAFTIVECRATALTHVIGPHGCKIKELMATTGATLLASGGGPGGAATVRIEGSAAQIAAAEALVRAIIKEEAHPDYAGPEGNRLRAEAEAHAQERSRLMGEADAAFKAEVGRSVARRRGGASVPRIRAHPHRWEPRPTYSRHIYARAHSATSSRPTTRPATRAQPRPRRRARRCTRRTPRPRPRSCATATRARGRATSTCTGEPSSRRRGA